MADRTRMPALGVDQPFAFPAIRKTRLSNGLELWTVQHRDLPVQTMVLLMRVGSSADPAGRSGLASLTGDMLDEGAGDLGALELNEALARIGAQFDTEVGPDATFLTLTSPSASPGSSAFSLLWRIIVARPSFASPRNSIASVNCGPIASGSSSACRPPSRIARSHRPCTASTRTATSPSARSRRSKRSRSTT